MKITKEQLRQIIKEEIGALTEYSGAEDPWYIQKYRIWRV